jgi:hypothetical protein
VTVRPFGGEPGACKDYLEPMRAQRQALFRVLDRLDANGA